jgi:hypothetical protein
MLMPNEIIGKEDKNHDGRVSANQRLTSETEEGPLSRSS